MIKTGPIGGGRGSSSRSEFYLGNNGIYFAPFFSPSRVSNSKERNLHWDENFCGGEDVTDTGSKNRDIHIAGLIKESEIASFDRIVESNDPHVLVVDGWEGEVRVKSGEWEGPVAFEPQSQERLFQYSFDFVSTGRDEAGDGYEDGIVNDGSTPGGTHHGGGHIV